MSTESAATESPETDDRPRLLALEVGEWPGLGHTVRLELSGRCTVLVGKNGAGKSLLLEGIFQAANKVFSPFPGRILAPGQFRCDLERPGTSAIAYEYVIAQDDAEENVDVPAAGSRRGSVPSWSERCWDLPSKKELWRIANSTLTVIDHEPKPFFPGVGLLFTQESLNVTVPELSQIMDLFFGIRFVPAGTPRSEGSQRREILLRRQDRRLRWKPTGRGASNC